ncbi:MAG: cobalamin-dependent protein [Rhodospirillaceae bacterium]|jgi:MerR family transcriptional regulator, light-induced transcriptional regulator|nr:cobalamin-dependent protein [Rhodospirillaceae bacterium]
MTQTNNECADVLTKNGQKIAAAASEHLLTENPEIKNLFGEDPLEHWTENFLDRITELSEALAAGQPQIFSSHVQWAYQAMSSRSLDTDYLSATLRSLRTGIEAVVPDNFCGPVISCLDEAVNIYAKGDALTWQSDLDPGLPLDRLALHYIQMVVSGNIWPGMQVVLDALKEDYTVKDLYLRVLLPAQAEVGRLWHLNEVSVAEEHLVTSTTQRLMAVLADHAARKSDQGYTVIASSVAGNAHDIGIRTIAYLMEFEGWKTIFLGSDMPRTDLPAAVKFYEADLVLLSIALTTQLKALKRAITDIRAVCGANVKIMVGGNGLRDTQDLWKELGADGYGPGVDEALDLAAIFMTSE